jgi:DNA primase
MSCPLIWAANLAALELHVPQWTVGPGPGRRPPDRIVFDLDPGPGTTIVECARVAERLHDVLVEDGLTPVAKKSGSKGIQVHAGVRVRSAERTSAYAKVLAERFATQTPELVTAKMAKNLRPGKVFIDWSQKQSREDGRRAVLAARPRSCGRVDTGYLGRRCGGAGVRSSWSSPQSRSSTASRSSGTCSQSSRRPGQHCPDGDGCGALWERVL